MSNELVTAVFQETGKKYGYENVSIEWTAFKQFKVQWQRSYNWIAFRLSDYMKDAPVEVWEDLADTLYGKIKGKDCNYSAPMTNWVTAPEFSQKHRQTFIKRGRYLTEDDGENKSLKNSLNRLVEAGLLPADHNIKVVWNNDTKSDMAGTYSVLMRTVMVNGQLDVNDIPDPVLDYVIYHQYLRIAEGTRTFGTDEQPSTREAEKKFPDYELMEKTLDDFYLVLT